MSSDVNTKFQQFGSKVLALAILALLSFIFGLSGYFNSGVMGVNFAVQLGLFIVLLLALKDIKEIGYALNNRLLLEFRAKLLYAIVLFIIGFIFFFGGFAGIIAVFIFSPSIAAFAALIVFLVIGIIILIIAAALRIQAWSRCNEFFKANSSMFPPNIANNAIDGSKYLKIAAILYLTVILTFIGSILELVGYFKLASLRNLGETSPQPSAAGPSTGPAYIPSEEKKASASDAQFCPHCGSSIKPGVKFCPNCGSQLS